MELGGSGKILGLEYYSKDERDRFSLYMFTIRETRNIQKMFSFYEFTVPESDVGRRVVQFL
jgi:hypothetical protein